MDGLRRPSYKDGLDRPVLKIGMGKRMVHSVNRRDRLPKLYFCGGQISCLGAGVNRREEIAEELAFDGAYGLTAHHQGRLLADRYQANFA